MEQHPLLTHEQLVDWLIYHCPLNKTVFDNKVFRIDYRPLTLGVTDRMTVMGNDPIYMYTELADYIHYYPGVHREITDLYWYWTIE